MTLKPIYPPRRLFRLNKNRPLPPTTQHAQSAVPPKRRKRRSALKTFYSVLYHTTFYFFILITAALLVGSAYGLGEQALRTGGQRRWNLFVLSAAYVALVSLHYHPAFSRRMKRLTVIGLSVDCSCLVSDSINQEDPAKYA